MRNNTAIRISAAATAVLALSVVIATRMPANAAPVKKNAVMAGKSGGRAFASKPVQPGTFLENKGQWGNEARFLLGSPGLNMWVTDKGIRYDFARFTQKPKMSKDQTYIQSAGKVSGHVVDLEFVGSSKTARAVGVSPTPGTYNYVRATGTYTGAQGFAETRIAGLYAGVDLRSYLDKGNPRFDVIVSPGADPKDVKFRYAGATNTRIGDSNTVYFTTRFGEVKVADLFAYQNSGANRSQVDCSFKKNADGTFGFAVGNYDESKPLVIDPIVYSTVFGGFAPPLTNLGIDGARGVAVDAFNNAYVTGFTNSPNYPATNGAYDNQVSGFDCFITKFRSDATNLVYSTFLGGTGTDQGLSITVDTQLRAIVAGATDSSGGGGTAVPFPTTPGAPQEIYGGGTTDAFLVRLSSNGANLEFGTFLGGSSPLFPIPPPGDIAFGVGVDGANNMYVVGQAVMPDFPTTASVIQPGFGGSTSDGFAARISEAGFMDYCTFLGGTGGDVATAVVVDNVGYAHVAGNTASPNFSTTAGSFDTSVQQQDGFICKINPSGTAFDFSTVLGGSSNEAISGIALDQQGNSYVCGASTSNDFPRTAGCYDDIYNPDFENFVTKVAIDGTSLVYSTFMNGANTQRGIGVDDLGVAYIVGNFGGALATSANGDDRTYNGPPLFILGDAYIQALDEAGSNLLFGSFYGGRNEDGGFAVAVDRSRNAYIVGSTNSDPDLNGLQGFPTTPGSFKETVSVDGLPPFDDGFLMKLKVRSTPLLQSIVIAPASIAGTENTTATLTLTGPASPGGAVIRLASNNEAVARPVDALGNLLDLIVIPEGATTTTFAISSSDVVSNFVVQISAELEGDTKRANVTVAPWLTNLVLSPNTIVGGNRATGRINLFRPASAGLTISISTSDATKAYAVDAGGTRINSFVVPTGNTTAVFDILSRGVDTAANVTLLAKISTPNLQVTRSQILRVLPASLRSLTFAPNRVNGGENAVGTVTLDGEAGPTPVRVDLRLGTTGNPPVGITLPNPPYVLIRKNANNVDLGKSVNFNVTAGVAAANSFRNVIAERLNTNPVQVKTATLFIDANDMVSVDLDRTNVVGGTTITGHVTLQVPAGSTGFALSVTTSDPVYAPFSGNRTTLNMVVPAGAIRSADFTIPTKLTRVGKTVTITASKPGYADKTATIIIRPIDFALSFVPNQVVGGSQNTVGTIALTDVAGTNGIRVALTSSDTTAMTVPSNITVPENSSSATFTGVTKSVTSPKTVTVTGTIATLPVPVVRTTTVRVNPLGILLTIDPISVVGGNSTTGRVTLSAPAGTSSLLVGLTSNNTAARVPANVRIPSGQTEATFTITTVNVSVRQLPVIKATTPAGISSQKTMIVNPVGFTLSFNPNPVTGGNGTTGRVTLGSTLTTLEVITLTSGNPGLVSVPANVTIPAGQTFKTFPGSTNVPAADTSVTMTARMDSGATATTSLRVLAPRIIEIFLNSFTVIGGDSTTGYIRIGAVAPAGGIDVAFVSSNPAVAQVPATVRVPAGGTIGTFTMTSSPTAVDRDVTLTASLNGTSSSVVVTILAPTLTSLEIIPAVTVGGNSVLGKVSIDKNAPAGGITVQLAKDSASTGSPYVGLPSSVTIPAGARSATFTITTNPVSRVVSALIIARFSPRGQEAAANLTLNPQ